MNRKEVGRSEIGAGPGRGNPGGAALPSRTVRPQLGDFKLRPRERRTDFRPTKKPN